MTNKDTKLIYEAYIISEDEVAPDDRAKLEAELADLKSQMDYYNHVDDHSKWQEETPKREKTLARISDIGNILNASSPPEEQEPRRVAIPGGSNRRFRPRDVNEKKDEFRNDGTFEKMGIADDMRNQTRVASFFLRYGVLPTEAEMARVANEPMAPVILSPSEHPELEGKVWKWDPPMAAPEDEAEDEEVYDDLVAGDIPDKADGRGHLVTPAIMAMYNIDPNADMDAVAKYLNL